ncbi:MAG: 23S rRNA (pseudouridine(1915)-N(3))-methyltransferase RlmH [Methanotrichaceae archaeon]|nr:23S rRNA (pseudouridine(1915)-N(3))-methyltransferase RlmH [Methanotrichaceae archaeon]
MIIRIIAVGKLRERYWQEAAEDYSRRLAPYARLEVLEVAESRIPERASDAEESKAVTKEGQAILERLKRHHGAVVALDRQGRSCDSLELASWLQGRMIEGQNEVAWIIGGPLGLSRQVQERADLILSFSSLTFPHQMARLILLEQIYRSFRIIHGQPYHK